MNIYKKTFIALISLLTLVGCQIKLPDFNPNQDSTKLAVDAMVSDSTGFHYVRLTKSVNILSTAQNPVVSNALVIVTDNVSLVDTFKLSDTTGLYLPSKLWKGIPGNTYNLRISTPEYNVTASDQMATYDNFKIDDLVPVFREKATKNRVTNFQYSDIFFTGKQYIKVDDSVFRVRIYALKNLPYRVNVQSFAYRGKDLFKSNNKFFVNNLSDIPIDDFFIFAPSGGGGPTNLHFLSGDTVTVALQGISDGCFVYYQGLNSVLSNDGGLFSSPAGNPPTNLNTLDAIGYFRTARITKKSVIVKFNGETED